MLFNWLCLCGWWTLVLLMGGNIIDEQRRRRRYRVIYGGVSHVRLVAAVASLAELFLLGDTDNWKAMDNRLHHLCHQIVEWALALYGWIHSAIVDVVKKVPHIFWHCPNSLWPPPLPRCLWPLTNACRDPAMFQMKMFSTMRMGMRKKMPMISSMLAAPGIHKSPLCLLHPQLKKSCNVLTTYLSKQELLQHKVFFRK